MKKYKIKKSNKILILNNLTVLFGILFILNSCIEKDPFKNYTADDSRVFISNYDKKINYKNYETFHLADSVFIINESRVRISQRSANVFFTNLFKEKLIAKGYKPMPKNQNPDLGITICRVANSKVGLNSPTNLFFNYYWNYPLFGETGFEYPGFYTYYEFGETTWNIEVVDLKNAKQNNKLNIVWNVQISGEGVFDEDNYQYILEKIFEISTFLGNE